MSQTVPDDAQRGDEYGAPAPRRSVPAAVPVVLGVVAALLLIGVAVLGIWRLVGSGGPSALDDARAAAVSAARQDVVNVTSFDYQQLKTQVARVERSSGGAFAAELARTKAALFEEITSQQRVSSSHVVETAVATATTSDVTVLLAVDEVRKTKADPAGTTLRYRMQVRMAKKGGQWLLVELRPVT